jgi:hypothetical protein
MSRRANSLALASLAASPPQHALRAEEHREREGDRHGDQQQVQMLICSADMDGQPVQNRCAFADRPGGEAKTSQKGENDG